MRKTICAARSCDELIARDKVFCIMHWAFLDPDIQEELMLHYVQGQYRDKRKATKKFRVALQRARSMLETTTDWGDLEAL